MSTLVHKPTAAISFDIARGSTSARLRSIDLLRGAAALAVVLHHAVTFGRPPLSVGWFRAVYGVATFGHLGVPLFFVISGFCIHLKWARQKSTSGGDSISFGSFWRRRMHRLYPPYFVVLCLSMALVLVGYLRHANVPLVTDYPQPRLKWMGLDFLFHAAMLHGLHPLFDKMGGNSPFWTLAREEYFYLMYFLLLPWRRYVGVVAAVATVVLLGFATHPVAGEFLRPESVWWPIVDRSALVLWGQWCLGMVAAEAYCGLISLPRWAFWLPMAVMWGVLAWLCNGSRLEPFENISWGLAFFTLMNYCIRLETTGRWPDGRITACLAKVGLFSYSLYLVHHPIKSVVKQLLGRIGATSDPVRYLACAGLMSLTGVAAGWLFFWLVERRFLLETRRAPRSSFRATQGIRSGASEDPAVSPPLEGPSLGVAPTID